MLGCTFYHGSKTPKIKQLEVRQLKGNPFGTAIYLTKEPIVADCYCRDGGAIYEVEIKGNIQFTINLDVSFSEQSAEAKSVIIRSLKDLGLYQKKSGAINARDFIHCHDTRDIVNGGLARNGIWMIYGHLNGMELSGLQDRGVQYAVIDPQCAVIVRETTYQEIMVRKTLLRGMV